MTSKFKLTWQNRKDGAGRWKKIYKGQIYYFAGGSGKSDVEAYRKALMDWERQKVVLDQQAEENKPHREAYEDAMCQWQAVLSWARENDDLVNVTAASMKLSQLRQRFESRSPLPIDRRRDLPIMQVGMTHGTSVLPLVSEEQVTRGMAMKLADQLDVPFLDEIERVHEIVNKFYTDTTWKNRIGREIRKSAAVEHEYSLQQLIDKYIKKRQASGGTAGGHANLKRHLDFFVNYLGAGFDAREISGSTIDRFHQHTLAAIESSRFTRESARSVQATVRSFIRWLWEIEILADLPRNLTAKSLRIVVEAKEVKAFAVEQLRVLFKSAPEQLQLFILLALNCGMTQMDIAEIHPDDVDWSKMTLCRKRGKTQQFDTVPKVIYPLWPETLRLLKKFRSSDPNRVLLAPEGGPLKFEVNRNGKVVKNDYVGLKFRRMLKAKNLTGQFKMLKKTSASLLRNHSSYIGLEGLFLDHAPRSMSDKHYAQIPTELLAEAVNWLRDQYQLQKSVPRSRRVRRSPDAASAGEI